VHLTGNSKSFLILIFDFVYNLPSDCYYSPPPPKKKHSIRILVNQSTFFVELAETAAALRGASRRSLVIMDELGRGTSTFDGTAIASATVQHLIERNKCLALFATHYHSLLEEWKASNSVTMGHMECLVEHDSSDLASDDCNITFLYTLGNGPCPKSFGINVARLAGLPDDVLAKAKRISTEFEDEMRYAERPISQKQRIVDAIHSGDWLDLLNFWQKLRNSLDAENHPPITLRNTT
jgi:DNA mismatch repair protein MSH6